MAMGCVNVCCGTREVFQTEAEARGDNSKANGEKS